MRVVVAKDILRANDHLAELNRQRFDKSRVCVINILGSPGSGKTTLLEAISRAWQGRIRWGVIEGDVAGTVDAERIERLGVPVVQINTGGACHLDAAMIAGAVDSLVVDSLEFLFIENVGNLVCPANFRLGEHIRLLLLSVPEGDDKPLKYPVIFRDVDAVVISKWDLRSYVNFDLDRLQEQLRTIAPGARLLTVSALAGEGIAELCQFLEAKRGEIFSRLPPS